MKVIASTAAIPFSNSDSCSGFEFAFGDPDLNAALVTVNGRYPETGHLINDVCKEIAYVLSGDGLVGVDEDTHELHPGDAVLVNPGERFFWQGEQLQMLMPCAPAFYPEQHKEVK